MILGACSLCGGTVEIPDAWYGIDPPRPTCRRCHATKKLAVIEMDEPSAKYTPKEQDQLWDDASRSKRQETIQKAADDRDKPLRGLKYWIDRAEAEAVLDDAEYLSKVGNG